MTTEQSSIDWLIAHLQKAPGFKIVLNEINDFKIDIIAQAKEMHKMEIIETHFNAQEFNAMMLHSAEEYYKSVFEKILIKEDIKE
jgi:hypothetical protein